MKHKYFHIPCSGSVDAIPWSPIYTEYRCLKCNKIIDEKEVKKEAENDNNSPKNKKNG